MTMTTDAHDAQGLSDAQGPPVMTRGGGEILRWQRDDEPSGYWCSADRHGVPYYFASNEQWERCYWVTDGAVAGRLADALVATRAERDVLLAGRVPCRMCNGEDDASVKNARCYHCRNRPYWDLEVAAGDIAKLAAELAARDAELAHIRHDLNTRTIDFQREQGARAKAEAELARERAAHEETIRLLRNEIEGSHTARLAHEKTMDEHHRQFKRAVAAERERDRLIDGLETLRGEYAPCIYTDPQMVSYWRCDGCKARTVVDDETASLADLDRLKHRAWCPFVEVRDLLNSRVN